MSTLSDASGGAAAGSAVGGPVGGVIGGVVGGIGGLLSGNAANEAKQEALNNYIATLQNEKINGPEDYVAKYQNIDPSALQQYVAQQEQAQTLQDSGLNNIKSDPALRAAQMQALIQLQNQGKGQMNIQDQAAEDKILSQAATANQGAQGAITQQMARQGMLGSGGALAARLAAQGTDYAAAGQNAEQLAAAHNANALQAVLNANTVASGLDTADYTKASNAARAQDTINQFNTQNKQNVGNYNTQAAQSANNSNVGQSNNLAYYNNNLANQQANQYVQGTLGSTAAANKQATDIANAKISKGDALANNYNNIGKGIAGTASSIGNFVDSYGNFGSKAGTAAPASAAGIADGLEDFGSFV